MRKHYSRKLKKAMKKNGSWHTHKWTIAQMWDALRFQIGYNVRQSIDYSDLWGTSVFDIPGHLVEKTLCEKV